MMKRDLKLRACMDAFADPFDLPEPKTEALISIAKSYERNIRRVNSLVLFPPAAVWITRTAQRCTDEIEFKFPNKDRRTQVALIEQKIKNEMRKQTAMIDAGGTTAKKLLEQQSLLSFTILSEQSEEFSDGPEAWLASQITGAWTAFEAMAGDLWEAALNSKPTILAKLAGRPSARKRGDEETNDPKRIKLDYLHKYKFDLSHRMGTIFVEDRRYRFDSLEGIRDAYLDAFSVDFDAIKKIVTDKSLDAISIVRNNLVHNGGIIDQQYLRRSSDLPSTALGNPGSPILVDGDLVTTLIKPVIKHGCDLVAAVDGWLTSH